jgi:hypothetical protein
MVKKAVKEFLIFGNLEFREDLLRKCWKDSGNRCVLKALLKPLKCPNSPSKFPISIKTQYITKYSINLGVKYRHIDLKIRNFLNLWKNFNCFFITSFSMSKSGKM